MKTSPPNVKLDPETEFLNTIIELYHGEPVNQKLHQLSQHIHWAKGYPTNRTSFWNAESFMWKYKIEKETREFITQELQHLLISLHAI